MKDILSREKFDLIHLHSPLVPTLPLLALLEARCPVVATFHTYFDGNIFYSSFKGIIQEKGVNKINAQLFVSKSCVASLEKYFRLKPIIIPNGVDVTMFNPEVEPLERFNDGKMNLLFLSRFDPRNGLKIMIKAFGIVRSAIKEARLIVVGSGPLTWYYQKLVPQELKNDIYFAGLARDERPRYYASCDIFCSPVNKASFGITLLEAMASGKPIVATENIGYKDLLGPEEGILVPADSAEKLAQAIIFLLKNEKLREEMGKKGRRKALLFSWDRIVPQIYEIYKEVLGLR